MRISLISVVASLCTVLAACTGTSKPALIHTSSGEVFTGTGTNVSDGGVLTLRSEDGASCEAFLPKIGWRGSTSSGNLRCTDGRSGTVDVWQDSGGRVRNGIVRFADGETGSLVLGDVAGRMMAVLPSLGSGSGDGSASGACKSEGYYGEISCLTGKPKTVRVRGYYRKDGTYVSPHYRSRPR